MLKDIALGAAAVLGAGLSIWTWLQSPSKANADAIKAIVDTLNAHKDHVSDELAKHDRRIQSVEAEQKHAPRKEDVHELKVAIVELQGTVRSQNVQIEAMARTVANIDGYLRKGDGK